jgi:hypothetical protein
MNKEQTIKTILKNIQDVPKSDVWKRKTAERIYSELQEKESAKAKFLGKLFGGIRDKTDPDILELKKIDNLVIDYTKESPYFQHIAEVKTEIYTDIISTL